jgi:hypothetical protein
MESGLQFVIGGLIGFIGVCCCLSVYGAVIGVPLILGGLILAFSRGN